MSLHRIEDVPHTPGEDGRRPPGGNPEGAEDNIVSGDRAIHGGRIEDITPHDAEAVVDHGHQRRVAGEGDDLVALEEGLLREQAARLACGPEENDLHNLAPPVQRASLLKKLWRFPLAGRSFLK